MVNKRIEEALNKKGIRVEGYSDIGLKIKEFEKWDNHNPINELFSFIIKNNLNRYLFSLLLRQGSLDIDKIPFNMKLLEIGKIKDTVKESFIKKYSCKNCDNLLFRKYIEDIPLNQKFEKECAYCEKNYIFDYQNLENDFMINRKDLTRFLESLVKIKILKKNSYYSCSICKNEEELSLEKIELACSKCKINRNIFSDYEFNSSFLKNALKFRDGSWFEWFVFKICNYLFKETDHNLMIEFDEDGMKKRCEIDTIALNENGDIIVFECKDYLHKTPAINEMGNLPTLSTLFEKVLFISSYGLDKKAKKKIMEICEENVKFIAGTDLEKQFISEENILTLVETNIGGATSLFTKLPFVKRKNLINITQNKLLGGLKTNLIIFSFFKEIIWLTPNIRDFIIEEDLKKIIDFCTENIEKNVGVSTSVEILHSLYIRCSLELLLPNFNIESYLELSIPYLNPLTGSGYDERKPFFNFLKDIIKENKITRTDLNHKKISDFLLKFIPMLDIYYGHNNRRIMLSIIEKLWEFENVECRNKFIEISNLILNDQNDIYSKADIVSDFFITHKNSFNEKEIESVRILLQKYINNKRENWIYVENNLKKL